jgi:hypothetical protein
MRAVLIFLNEKVKPNLFALLFVTALLLISLFLERRHIYF